MSKILITGATGNVGVEIIRYFHEQGTANTIVAGVRDIEKAKKIFSDFTNIQYVHFDFEKVESFDNALSGIDRVFLLRPPHISDVDKYFRPLIEKIKEKSINQLVFLSVQGAEKSKIIPHNKIERLITDNSFEYIFVRPAYFMQNLTTTLMGDIKSKRKIILPAGNAKFNWIDIENIAEATALLLDKFEEYKNRAFEITGTQNKCFADVLAIMNKIIEKPIQFQNINPVKFFVLKNREKMEKGMILVMIMLHFLPRFSKEPYISSFYENLTGKKPTDLETFIRREKQKFE